MAYVDLNTIHNPSTGTAPPASWGDQVRDNFEYFNTLLRLSAFATYTPALVQSGAVSKTVSRGVYVQLGKLVIVTTHLAVTGAGTAANIITISLPVTAAYAGNTMVVGSGYVFDASAGTIYGGPVTMVSVTTVGIMLAAGTAGNNTMTAALAGGDTVSALIVYEAA